MQNIFNESLDFEEIDITPDISLFPKLGSAGYSAPQAIAELVDNCIDARLEGEKLLVNVNISDKEISIADNGTGMVRDVAANSLKLGLSRKKGQLGEFGLGLKTSCLSLGDSFKIITKAKIESLEYYIDFDKKEWEDAGKNWRINLHQLENKSNDHFTIIEIKKLKVFYPNLSSYILKDLQKRYAPFIRTGEVVIKVNKKLCIAEEINISAETKKTFEIILKGNKKIKGWYALLKEGSQKGFYGFSTFRRGRMIGAYEKIGFDSHPTLARIVGEINMDHVPVTHTKREFETESKEYREVLEVMREELKELVKSARKKSTQDTITAEIKAGIEIWKDKITETLRMDDFKRFTAQTDDKLIRDNNGNELGEVIVEKRSQKKEKIKNKKLEIKEPERKRNPSETHLSKRHVIKIKGKNIKFEHEFSPLGIDAGWKTYNYTSEKGLEIFTNIDFPAYAATKDKVFYAVLHIAESVAEIFIQTAKEDFSNVEEIKELILRKASELKEQF